VTGGLLTCDGRFGQNQKEREEQWRGGGKEIMIGSRLADDDKP
jgi:hypothetical protein